MSKIYLLKEGESKIFIFDNKKITKLSKMLKFIKNDQDKFAIFYDDLYYINIKDRYFGKSSWLKSELKNENKFKPVFFIDLLKELSEAKCKIH